MLAFINAGLIDGTGAPRVTGATVLVEGKRITAAGRGVAVPADATVIDLRDKTVLPGLIDAHTHIGNTARPPGMENARDSQDFAGMRDGMLAYGVTTARSCGDFLEDSLAVRDKIDRGELRGPRLLCCGKILSNKDGHPSRTIWRDDPELRTHVAACPETPAQARRMVRELVEAGVDCIKTIVSDCMILVFPKTFPPLPDDVMQTIIDEGHRLGRWQLCHIDRPSDAIKLIDYGADEIDHLISPSLPQLPGEEEYDRLFTLMVAKGTWLVPTITAVRAVNYLVLERGAPATVDEYIVPHLRRAYEAGVRMGCGCDSGGPVIPWGRSLHDELREYVRSLGMSPLEAITCATMNNSIILGLDQTVGTVAAGKLADLLIVGGDPARDIDQLGDVRMVLKEGAIVVDRMSW